MRDQIFSDLLSTALVICEIDNSNKKCHIYRNVLDPSTETMDDVPLVEGELSRTVFSSFVVHPEDRAHFAFFGTNRDIIGYFLNNPDSGNYFLHFRLFINDQYRWVAMEAIPAQGFSAKCMHYYLIFRYTNGPSYGDNGRLYIVYKSLSEKYESIYYMNRRVGRLIAHKIAKSNGEFGNYLRTKPLYEEAMKRYVLGGVYKDDRPLMMPLTRIDNVVSILRLNPTYSIEHRISHVNGFRWYRITFARMDNGSEIENIAVAFADISEEKKVREDFFRNERTVLVSDNDVLGASKLVNTLRENYEVIYVRNGENVYRTICENAKSITTIILSDDLLGVNVARIIKDLRQNMDTLHIPIVVAGQYDTEAYHKTYFNAGASDFIKKPYNIPLILNRLQILMQYREAASIINTMEYDRLTGLFNREFFIRGVENELEKHPAKHYILMASDIEDFKLVNEKYGKRSGDEFLKSMAELHMGMPNYILGGRYESDHNMILLEEDDIQIYQQYLDKGLLRLSPDHKVVVKHAFYHVEEHMPVQDMCDRAMLALERIKGVFSTNYTEYSNDLHVERLKRQDILENAYDALEKGQFEVYYQPKHDTFTGKICGAEALVRWIHPELGFMNPSEFIPLFEQNGFITMVDEYVIRQTCKDLHKWQKAGYVCPISINMSRRDFELVDLAAWIKSTVNHYELDHSLLHIEVTESAYAFDPDKITATIKQLHDAGFVIELDDFGTGYSSITALNRLDLDILKIDMSIVQNDVPNSDKNILEFTMQLAKMIHVKTVAEGVETTAQLERMKALGVDYIQGYYYSKALPKDEFETYLKEHLDGVKVE